MSITNCRFSEIVTELAEEYRGDNVLSNSYKVICRYLIENPDKLSWRGKNKPNLNTEAGVRTLAIKYFTAYRKSDFPVLPATIPDKMVGIVMELAYSYSVEEYETIKITHQQAMCAENTVGALLERYIDHVLRDYGWYWCCGSFVKAIDFIKEAENGSWYELQVKNRDNSENSSSSAIRQNTNIQKWFRSKSRTGETNWENLPPLMRGHGLSEEGFISYVKKYLETHKNS